MFYVKLDHEPYTVFDGNSIYTPNYTNFHNSWYDDKVVISYMQDEFGNDIAPSAESVDRIK